MDANEDISLAALPAEVKARTFVVIPAYNEGPALAKVVAEVRQYFDHVVVVDDGSRDNTHAVAQDCARYVLKHLINRGQGAAIQTGIEFALIRGADFVVTFDADGQHRVEDIPALLAPILNGDAEIALGSRFLGSATDLPATRRLVLKAGVWFTRIFNGVRLTDAHNGLRAFSRKAAQRIHIRQDRMAHASEIIDLIRETELPFVEVPVTIRYTEYSLAKGQSARGALRIAFHYLIGKMVD